MTRSSQFALADDLRDDDTVAIVQNGVTRRATFMSLFGGLWAMIPNRAKGDESSPDGAGHVADTLDRLSRLTIPDGTDSVTTTGRSIVGDDGAGMTLVYDAAVDKAYVNANPTTSFLDANGRGFRRATMASSIGVASGATVQDALDSIAPPSATITLYTNERTGSDTRGAGSSNAPFATVQKAIDAATPLLTGRAAIRIVVTGDVTTSSRSARNMDRPALIYIDGVKIGRRTDAPGSTMIGGLVIDLSAATVKPNKTFPRGIYVTGHAGSVGILGGAVVAQAGAQICIVAHRGSYVHIRDTVINGNGNARLGLVAEGGGHMETIDVSATNSATDVQVYYQSTIQITAPGKSVTIGTASVGNSGTLSIVFDVTITGEMRSRGGMIDLIGSKSTPVKLSGNYDGQGGTVTGSRVQFTNSASSIIPVGEQWKIDALSSDAQLNFRGGTATLNGFQSFVEPASQSTFSQPIRALDGAKITFSATMNSKASNGLIVAADLGASSVDISKNAQEISLSIDGQPLHVLRLANSKGSTAVGCTLSRELTGYMAGTRVPNGQIVMLFNISGAGIEIVNGKTLTGLNGASITLGTRSGQTRSMTVVYHSLVGQWVPVSFGQVVP